jgi:hypothetical protein
MADRELMQQAHDALLNFESDISDEMFAVLIALRARLAQPEPEPVACIVKDCENHKHQGRFVGDLCSPCHAFITRNEGKYSQAYRNAQREWQGLTAEDLAEIPPNCYEGAIWADARLKEKNT